MTSRERMLAAIRGEACDRLPWAPELNWAFVGRVLEGEDVPSERRYVEACRRIGADCLLSTGHVPQRMQDVEVEREVEGATTIVRWRTPAGELTSREEARPDAETCFEVEHKIKSVEDLRVYRRVVEGTRLAPDAEATCRAAVERAIQVVGDDGIISLAGPATPIMHLLMTDLRAPTMHYLLADHEEEVAGLFEAMHALNVEVYHVLARMPGELVRPFEDTTTTLLSPALYRRYCQTYMAEYAAIVQAAGKLFVPHLCGLLRNVLPDLRDTGIDGIEALTPPETGDTPFALARQALGPTAVLIGGLDPTWFSVLSPDAMRARVREVLAQMGDGRYTMLGHEEISVRADMGCVRVVPEVLAEAGPVPFATG